MVIFRMILYDITWLDINLYPQAVELDPVIVDIAREYFSFVDDKRLKVVNIFVSFSSQGFLKFSVCLGKRLPNIILIEIDFEKLV